MKVPNILKNKYVCYALMALASLNIIGYLTVKAWECLALFTLTAYSCYCYCNNISCSILAALFVANFVFGCGRVKEGFEDMLKGPGENMEDAATSAQEAADKQNDAGNPEGASDAEAVAAVAAATADAFKASKENCCDGTTGNLKGDLADNQGACDTWVGDSANSCPTV